MLAATIKAQLLDKANEELGDDKSKFLVVSLKTDVYSPDAGLFLPSEKIRKRGWNHQQYISVNDLDQISVVEPMVIGQYYFIRVAVFSKSTGPKSSKVKLTFLQADPIEAKDLPKAS